MIRRFILSTGLALALLGPMAREPVSAAQDSPLMPPPPRGAAGTVGIRMGDMTFLIPKDLYAAPTMARAEEQFAFTLSLTPLADARPDAPRTVSVSVLHDPSGRARRAERRELVEFVDGATMRVDDAGFFHYPNEAGVRVETEDAKGERFALQCSPPSDAAPACRRDAWYSGTIQVVYRYPRSYLAHALEIETDLFRVLDQLKSN
jgi:hypothetical protein